jgi:acyl carrier protein
MSEKIIISGKNSNQIRKEIIEFIRDNFILSEEESIQDEESLLEKGVIDSTGVLELVAHIEEKYDIVVDDEELVPANLDSIGNIIRFILRKMGKLEESTSGRLMEKQAVI